jgi:pyruvate,water dikinase
MHTKDFPPEMKKRLVDRYRQLGQRCGIDNVAVATRSAGAKSHPGQYETHLNVRGEADYLEKVKLVWASSFNPRSLSARKSRGLALESDPIGVAVLKMANARSAGVLFTADPNTGDSSKMIIESNWGLGESVVGGQSMPDVFVIDKDALEPLQKTLGSKKYLVRFKDVGVVEEETPLEMREQYSLTDAELSEIGRLGKALEAHFDVPQDTEWAIDQDFDFPDSVILLQTRPEIIAHQKDPVDQVLDMMTSQFGF